MINDQLFITVCSKLFSCSSVNNNLLVVEELKPYKQEIKIDNNDSEKKFLSSQGFRTVPQIYNELGEHIGGFTDLREYFENGEYLI